ncbi:MAG: hypothetical protein O7A08_07820 [SAR324 cluster bacterium]|nr:hypothetical protein [SAR324 cluster bacterium]
MLGFDSADDLITVADIRKLSAPGESSELADIHHRLGSGRESTVKQIFKFSVCAQAKKNHKNSIVQCESGPLEFLRVTGFDKFLELTVLQ